MRKIDHCFSVIAIVAIFIGLAGSLVIVSNAYGAMVRVNSLDDPGDGICDMRECTLREAIEAAESGDRILFAVTGTITLAGTSLIIDKDLTIIGPGPEHLLVSGDYASRVLYVDYNVKVKIRGVTITEGDESDGSGIFNRGNLILRYCKITGCGINYAVSGVGIYNDASGKLTIKFSIISDNYSDEGEGAGIYNAGDLNIIQSEISDNFTTFSGYGVGIYNSIEGNLKALLTNIADNIVEDGGAGGGIYNEGHLIITLSDISSNGYTYDAGGIENAGMMKIRHCNVSKNIAGDGWGGGIYNYGQLRLIGSRIEGNLAFTNADLTLGGGIENSGEMTIRRSTITNNYSQAGEESYGGGISNSGNIYIIRSNITHNEADNGGGGVFNEGSLTLKKTNITDNIPDDCIGCQ